MKNKKRIILIALMVILCFVLIYFITPARDNSVALAQAAPVVSQADVGAAFRRAGISVVEPRRDPADFSLTVLSGGSARLSDYKGKVVILNFWATWCPPCVAEMPSMENLYKQYKDKGVEILAVDLRENVNTVRQFINNNGYTFPVLLDRDGRVGGLYGVEAIPTTYIIDREGKIAGRIVGSIYWDTPQVIAAIETLL